MRVTPDFADSDAVLEYAARLVEEGSFADLRGIWSKRKRDREDAELRRQTKEETRKECAEFIRAFKSRRDLDAVNVLRKISEQSDTAYSIHLIDAWPLAWKGWLNIYCTVKCNSNCLPPETIYRIELTDEGRALLAQEAPPSDDRDRLTANTSLS